MKYLASSHLILGQSTLHSAHRPVPTLYSQGKMPMKYLASSHLILAVAGEKKNTE